MRSFEFQNNQSTSIHMTGSVIRRVRMTYLGGNDKPPATLLNLHDSLRAQNTQLNCKRSYNWYG